MASFSSIDFRVKEQKISLTGINGIAILGDINEVDLI